MNEVWAEIEEFPNYLVSNYGDIINIKFNRILKPRSNSKGYSHVVLFNEGYRKEFYVHQLVAAAFIANYRPKIHIQHMDGNKQNNKITNLRIRAFTTEIENGVVYYKTEHLRGRKVKILETGEVFINAYSCAKHIGGHASNIYSCLRGRYKTHMGYTFEYYTEGD